MNKPDLAEKIAALRRDYTQRGLSEHEAAYEPVEQFTHWLNEAIHARLVEPNAMVLATAAPDGRPVTRTVLLKDVDTRGFVFFTNYDSAKGHELRRDPRASLLFLWLPLERQVRVEGVVERVSAAESDAYFHKRPHDAQLAAWTSPQSHVIPNREFLEEKFKELKAFYSTQPVTRPPHWGGFRLLPDCVEFWQGRPNRLHDRLRYRLQQDRWNIERLAP